MNDWSRRLPPFGVNLVALAKQYVTAFNHGTPGHQHLVLLARLANLLDQAPAAVPWRDLLDERQRKEIAWSQYVTNTGSYCPGREEYSVIARMAGLLDAIDNENAEGESTPQPGEDVGQPNA